MKNPAGILLAVDTFIHKILLFVAQVALFAMIAIVCTTVFYRYVLNAGIIWAEEIPRTLVALFAFIACAMGVRDHMHIGLGFFYNRFPENGVGRKSLDFCINICLLFSGFIMLYYGWNLCGKVGKFTMPATGFPRWIQYISMPIAGGIIMYDSILFLFGILKEDNLLYSEKEEEFEVIHLEKHHESKVREIK